MKRSLLIALCVVFCSSMAFAQAGSIGVFADPGATVCEAPDMPGLLTLYVVHNWTPGSTASQWKMDMGSTVLTFLGETYPFPTVIGNTQVGISIAYGGCFTGPILLATINFFANGISPICSYITVVPDPLAPSGNIEVVDCAVPAAKSFGTGGQFIINPDPSTGCTCAWPVQESTWGGVKALYQ